MLIPFKWLYFFRDDNLEDVKPDDYIYISQLEKYAVKNDNAVAYNYYREITDNQNKEEQVEYFCLAFLLATFLDIYACFENELALVSAFLIFFDDTKDSFWTRLLFFPFFALYIFCFYFGIIRGGRFSLRSTYKVYFPIIMDSKIHNKCITHLNFANLLLAYDQNDSMPLI